MSNFVGNLLLTTIICSALILIVLAVSPLLKKYTIKWRYIVFMLVAVKLLLPMPLYTSENAIVIPMEKTVHNEVRHISNSEGVATENKNSGSEKKNINSNVNQNIANQTVTEQNGQQLNSQVENMENNININEPNQSIEKESNSIWNNITLFVTNINMNVVYTILFIIWCIGFLGFSFFYIIMYFYHKKNLNRWSSNINDENLLKILEEEKERLGVSKEIVLKRCKKINTPMTLGFRHISIVLPNTEYNQEAIRYILRHELTHQKRHDIYSKVLLIATKCLHWFNPIVPMMVNRAYDDMEILCDEMVVTDMEKAQRIEYNEMILSIAKSKTEEVTGKNILFAFCFVEKESNLKERVKNIMIMGKRKKGYQIVALAMAVIVAGSCFISCGKKSNKPAEELYNEYIKETLVEEYGLADVSEFEATLTSYNYNNITTSRRVNLEGIVSAYIEDMDNDGTKDLVVLRYERKEEKDYNRDVFQMIMSVYTVEDGKVSELDQIYVGPTNGKWDGENIYVESVMEKETSEVRTEIKSVTDGEGKYIMVNSRLNGGAFSDGVFEYIMIYELKDDKLSHKYSFEQTAGGSAGFEYTGYIDGKGTLLYNQVSGEEGEKTGKYNSYEEAIDGFFKDINIKVERKYVKSNNGYEYLRLSVDEDNLISDIYSYTYDLIISINEFTGTNTTAKYQQYVTDNTELLKNIGLTNKDTVKEESLGCSKEAKEVFEKIKDNDNYCHSILNAAIELQKQGYNNKDIYEEEKYYWSSIGVVLGVTDYEKHFKDFDIKLVNDTETYYIVEPKLVEAIGQVFIGSVFESNSIPLGLEEFSKQEPNEFSYPYIIEYKEKEDKYCVRYGEIGATYFEDCEYTIYDNDTMTITGKATRSQTNVDEYMYAKYKISVVYNPENSIYGFSIVNIKEIK